MLILYFVLEIIAVSLHIRTISVSGSRVLSGHHMSRDHLGRWRSYLITCRVVRQLISIGLADLLFVPAAVVIW